MSMSGVELAEEALTKYKEFKNEKANVAIVIYSIKNSKMIEVDEVIMKSDLKDILSSEEAKDFKQLDGEPDDWAVLRYTLTKGQSLPRYATCRLSYHSKDTNSGATKIAFITWCRDDAPVKLRMLISSTKDGIAKKLDGIQHRLQANDDGDLDFFENAKVVSKGQAVF